MLVLIYKNNLDHLLIDFFSISFVIYNVFVSLQSVTIVNDFLTKTC